MPSLPKFIIYLRSRAGFSALAILASMFGLSLRDVPWDVNAATIMIALAGIIFVSSLVRQFVQYSRLLGLVRDQELFRPLAAMDEPDNEPQLSEVEWYQRANETKAIWNTVCNNPQRHIVVVGESGVGKSILLSTMLPEYAHKDGFEVIKVDEYARFFQQICFQIIGTKSLPEPARAQWRAFATAVEDLTPDTSKEHYSELTSHLIGLLNAIGEHGKWLFIFDQAERLLQDFASLSESNQAPHYIELLRTAFVSIRQHQNNFSIFAVRSDVFYNALDSLLFMEGGDAEPPERVLTHVFLRGIDSNNHDAYAEMMQKFELIIKKLPSRQGNRLQFRNFVKVVSLDSSRRVNTFYTEMTGYLIEHFYRQSAELRRHIDSGSDRRAALLDMFIARILDGYVLASNTEGGRKVISVVLYTLATPQSFDRQTSFDGNNFKISPIFQQSR